MSFLTDKMEVLKDKVEQLETLYEFLDENFNDIKDNVSNVDVDENIFYCPFCNESNLNQKDICHKNGCIIDKIDKMLSKIYHEFRKIR